MNTDIHQFQTALGVGARTSKFRVSITSPSGNTDFGFTPEDNILCKAAAFPEKSIGQVPVYKNGRKVVIAGETEFSNSYTLEFYLTQDHSLRNKMVEWMNSIDNFKNNTHTNNIEEYMAELTVFQTQFENADASSGTDVKDESSVTLFNCFPSTVSEVRADSETTNTVQIFSVTFTYTYWE